MSRVVEKTQDEMDSTKCSECIYCVNRQGCDPLCAYDVLNGTNVLGEHMWIGWSIYDHGSRLPDCPLFPISYNDRIQWEAAVNHPDDYYRLRTTEKRILCDWITSYIIPRKTPNNWHTSYGLKHRFSSCANGFYITNGQFKGAMDYCGFHPVSRCAINWVFRISAKSPALKMKEWG